MAAQKDIRVLIIDENSIFRRGLAAALRAGERFQVVGLLGEPEEVRRKAAELRPDVVVIDLGVEAPGLDQLLIALQDLPGARILALAEATQAGTLRRAFQAGASGYLPRSAKDEELWRAVEAVHRGETYLSPTSPELMQRALGRREAAPQGARPLTRRETEILRLVTAEGLSSKEVAARLNISVRTVENHRASIMRKLDLRGVVELVKYAVQTGLVPIERG